MSQIEVGEREWKHSDRGILYAPGIQAFVGVSFYSQEDRLGILGHFSPEDLYETNGIFRAMHASARRWITDVANTRIWIGGGEYVPQDMAQQHGYSKKEIEIIHDTTSMFRGDVEATFEPWRKGGSSVRVQWLDTRSTVNYSLNVDSGEDTIEIQEI